MRDKSSKNNKPKASPWFQTRLWWPVEYLPVALEIVYPRLLTALEWALLRVVDVFREAPPPLSEVAQELGIEDASFLEDALREVIRLRALKPRYDGASSRDLQELNFTELGYTLYQKGKIEGQPSEHGHSFFFDALTDQPLSLSLGELHNDPEKPFPSNQAPREPRTSIGLDRARKLVRRFDPKLLKGDGEIRSVNPAFGLAPQLLWKEIEITLNISPSGSLEYNAPALEQEAHKYLKQCDWLEEQILPHRIVSEDWASRPEFARDAISTFAEWNEQTNSTLSCDKITKQVLSTVNEAKKFLALHEAWLNIEGLDQALNRAIQRGVHVLVIGTGPAEVFEWKEGRQLSLGLRSPAPRLLPGALIADKVRGLLLADVPLQVEEIECVVEMVGSLTAESSEYYHELLVEAMLDTLSTTKNPLLPQTTSQQDVSSCDEAKTKAKVLQEDPTLRLLLAPLAFAPNAVQWEPIVDVVQGCSQGLTRIFLLQMLAPLAKSLAPSLEPKALLEHAFQEWQLAVEQHFTNQTTFSQLALSTLVEAAPDTAVPDELILRSVQSGVSPQDRESRPLQTLRSIAETVDRRWGRHTSSKNKTWQSARDQCLQMVEWSAVELKELVEDARGVLPTRELNEWAQGLLQEAPRPARVDELQSWLELVEPLKSSATTTFQEQALDLWKQLLRAHPKQRKSLLEKAVGVIPAEELGKRLITTETTPTELHELVQELRETGHGLDDKWWSTSLRQTLPKPESVPTTSSIDKIVDDVVRIAKDWKELGQVGQSWGKEIADAIPEPTSAAGLLWWIEELLPLRSLLGPVLSSKVKAQLSAFRGDLEQLRQAAGNEWLELQTSCAKAGVTQEMLNALLEQEKKSSKSESKKKKKVKKDKKKKRKKKK